MKTFNQFIKESKSGWNKNKLRALADKEGIIKGFKPGTKSLRVKIWDDGKITRYDVDLSLVSSKGLTVKEVVKMFKLTDKDMK